MATFKIKRGLQAELPQLEDGELGLTLDTKKLYAGSMDGNIEFPNSKEVEDAIMVALNEAENGLNAVVDEIMPNMIIKESETLKTDLNSTLVDLENNVNSKVSQVEEFAKNTSQNIFSTEAKLQDFIDNNKFLTEKELSTKLKNKADKKHSHSEYLTKSDLEPLNSKVKKALSNIEKIPSEYKNGTQFALLGHKHKIADVVGLQDIISGTQYKTFVTVGRTNADYITDGVADDVQIQAAITFVNGLGGGEVFVKEGTYNFTSKVQLKSNVTLVAESVGSVIFNTAGTISGGNHRGLLEVTSQDNVVVDGISFDVSTANTAILGSSFTKLKIINCSFTGTGTGQSLITLGTYTSGGIWDDAKIQDCKFIDCINTYPIFLYTFSSRGPINNIKIDNNYFNNVKYACVKFTATSGLVKNVKIRNNDAYNIVGDVSGGTTNGVFVTGGLDAAYQIRDVLIKDNFYQNDLEGYKKGFVFFYSADNIKIIGNTALDLSSDTTGCIFMAPGRVSSPLRGLMIKDNWIEGWQAFWDPDSMTDVEVSGNTVKDCLTGIPMGYGTQDRVDIHHNRIYNSAQSNFPAAIVVGTQTAGTSVKYHDNIIYDDRSDSPILYFLMTTGNGVFDSRHIEVYNNKLYLPQITLTQHIYKQFSSNLLPQKIEGNFIQDASAITNLATSVHGNITGATTFDVGFGTLHTGTLTGNVTLTLTSGYYIGQPLKLILIQDGTGSRLMTWPSNFKKVGGTLTLSTGINAKDTIEMRWDGTNWNEISRSLGLS